jgi:hypothetical protein
MLEGGALRRAGSQELAPPSVVRFRDSLFGLGSAGSLPTKFSQNISAGSRNRQARSLRYPERNRAVSRAPSHEL